MQQKVKDLFEYIEASTSKFHAIKEQKDRFISAGFLPLDESESWKLEYGKSYFVTRNDSTIAAFVLPTKSMDGISIMASHSDSPSFKIKNNPEMKEASYVKLNTEKYGGMLMAPWFDRPLSIAGRVIVSTKDGLETRLINFDRDLCMLPSLAIHMNRSANDGNKYNPQKDMLPLISMSEDFDLYELVAKELHIKKEEIMGEDLYLYSRDKGCIWGSDEEFLSIGRLDDLECAYASMHGMIDSKAQENRVLLHVTFDNEEVGSGTKQGADSTFLKDVILRINKALGNDEAKLIQVLANSFMVSADNAHALHPNYSEFSDPTNKVLLNNGIVLKFSAAEKYMTDGLSGAIFKEICKKNTIPYQVFVNKSDIPGGSTLGNILSSHISVAGVDIGVPQLAMHSPFETAGVQDTENILNFASIFYKITIEKNISGIYNVRGVF